MGTHLLIFPVTLSDSDFSTIEEIKKSIESLFSTGQIKYGNSHSEIMRMLSGSVFNVREILTARYQSKKISTSYELNMIILKLEYAKELMIKEVNYVDDITLLKIKNIQFSIRQLLIMNWETYYGVCKAQ